MFKAVKDFLNQVYLEMNKVSWPTYSELRGSTYLIIIFSFIFVVFLFAVDLLVREVVSALL